MTSHCTWGSVTTLHDIGGALGRPLDTFFWALTISWSRLLACVWSGPHWWHICTHLPSLYSLIDIGGLARIARKRTRKVWKFSKLLFQSAGPAVGTLNNYPAQLSTHSIRDGLCWNGELRCTSLNLIVHEWDATKYHSGYHCTQVTEKVSSYNNCDRLQDIWKHIRRWWAVADNENWEIMLPYICIYYYYYCQFDLSACIDKALLGM